MAEQVETELGWTLREVPTAQRSHMRTTGMHHISQHNPRNVLATDAAYSTPYCPGVTLDCKDCWYCLRLVGADLGRVVCRICRRCLTVGPTSTTRSFSSIAIPADTHSFPELSSELSTTGVSHTSRWMLVSGQVYEALGDLRACVEVTARRVPSGAHHTNPRHSQQFAKLS